ERPPRRRLDRVRVPGARVATPKRGAARGAGGAPARGGPPGGARVARAAAPVRRRPSRRQPGRQLRDPRPRGPPLAPAARRAQVPRHAMRAAGPDGWAWAELEQIDRAAGGSGRAEVDALRLMSVFLSDWDTKDSNQRLVCLDPTEPRDGCGHSFAYQQDVGET